MPPVVVCWPISKIAKAAARAWDKIAKYAPLTRRRKMARPSTAATAAGRSRMAIRVTTGERNGSHQPGTMPLPYSTMKSGALPGPASVSLRCMAMM